MPAAQPAPDRAMRHIAARAIHDINNPLAAMKNSLLLIRDAIPVAHPNFEYLATIENSIAKIAEVTRRLGDAIEPPRPGAQA